MYEVKEIKIRSKRFGIIPKTETIYRVIDEKNNILFTTDDPKIASIYKRHRTKKDLASRYIIIKNGLGIYRIKALYDVYNFSDEEFYIDYKVLEGEYTSLEEAEKEIYKIESKNKWTVIKEIK